MVYSEAKLKSNVGKASPCFGQFLQEVHETGVYLCGFYCRVLFSHILISQTSG